MGEDSGRQFKRDTRNADSLAAEVAAFANSEGGTIFLGVRALENWPEIEFADDRDGCLFTVTVHRRPAESLMEPEESSQKSSQKIIEQMRGDREITIARLAKSIGITDRAIRKQIEKLKGQGRIRRVGPDKGGIGRLWNDLHRS